MNKMKLFFSCILLLLLKLPLNAQDSNCTNLDFGLGNFTNWTGYTWRYSTESPSINTSKVQGIVSRRQTIMSDTTAYDSNTGNALRKIPSGYKYSVRLGDAIESTDSNPRCWEQSLRYTMTIDSTNALLIMKFACVLQYASDHTAKMEPRFRLTLFDKNGDTIPDCSNYDVYSSNNYVKGFNTYQPSSSSSGPGQTVSPVKWRDWTTVGANLVSHLGQTITVEFMSADCTGKYHYGYAYFVADCQPLSITVKYCEGDSVATLTAPEGFETYSWTNSNGTVIDTSRILKVDDPVEGAKYTCIMVSATGCKVSLQSVIANYDLKLSFSSYMLDCKSNQVQFVNQSTTTHGSLIYKWDFGEGFTSQVQNPKYTFATSGMHEVTLILTNPPSSCTDTLTQQVESFSPPLVGISGDSTYCPGLSVFLKGYGAYRYIWNTGSIADSIEIRAPGGDFWLLGYSSTGCVSDTINRTIGEEPDWEFLINADTTLCAGRSCLISASGAATYLWNTGSTNDSITITSAGTYHLTGANKRGCEKFGTFQVVEYPLPKTDFTLSPSSLNSRHNLLTCSLTPQINTYYIWNMGDGTTESGSTVQHEYLISNSVLRYTIQLTATDVNCADSVYKTIDVVPFVPNVFSPNGDEINDVFMKGLDIQVFDRNGIVIYKGSSGWDGRYNGKIMSPDTYFYLLNYTDADNRVQTKKGYVTLER
jgi:gliding motility-associated-like protein